MSIPSRITRALAPVALVGLAACRGSDALTAPAADDAPHPVASSASGPAAGGPDLLAALDDADTRLAPSLAALTRAPLRAALAALRDALTAGDAPRGRRALAAVRALLVRHARDGDGDGADLAAVALLADAAAPVVDAAVGAAPDAR